LGVGGDRPFRVAVRHPGNAGKVGGRVPVQMCPQQVAEHELALAVGDDVDFGVLAQQPVSLVGDVRPAEDDPTGRVELFEGLGDRDERPEVPAQHGAGEDVWNLLAEKPVGHRQAPRAAPKVKDLQLHCLADGLVGQRGCLEIAGGKGHRLSRHVPCSALDQPHAAACAGAHALALVGEAGWTRRVALSDTDGTSTTECDIPALPLRD
jgi:hypothetical protein